MSNIPLIRRFTRAAPGALNVDANATDDETGLTYFRTSQNVILDIVSCPQPAAGVNYRIALLRSGGIDTGRRFFSVSLDPASAGRVSVGPIQLSGGDYFFSVRQTLGALAAYSFIVKFAKAP